MVTTLTRQMLRGSQTVDVKQNDRDEKNKAIIRVEFEIRK